MIGKVFHCESIPKPRNFKRFRNFLDFRKNAFRAFGAPLQSACLYAMI